MSRKREHGRIISVESMTRGDALAEDAAAGATSITVDDAGDFDEDGGWLTIGGQVVEFTECDDDTGVITLADPLTAAAEQGDPVQVWSDLYEEVIDYQQALVELDGEYDNPDPVVAEVAEGVGELPEGDRGRAGESCTLHRVAEDEWEVVGVGGRPKTASGVQFDQDRAAASGPGEQSIELSHVPIQNSEHLYLNGIEYHESEGWSRSGQTVTIGGSLARDGDTIEVEYAYRKGVAGKPLTVIVPFGATAWSYRQIAPTDSSDYSGVEYDDSAWSVGQAAFGGKMQVSGFTFVTAWASETRLWLRRSFPAATDVSIHVKVEDGATIYVNGHLVGSTGTAGDSSVANLDPGVVLDVPAMFLNSAGNVLAVRADDEYGGISPGGPDDMTYIDVEISGRLA